MKGSKVKFYSAMVQDDFYVPAMFSNILEHLNYRVSDSGNIVVNAKDTKYKHLEGSVKKAVAFLLRLIEAGFDGGGYVCIRTQHEGITKVSFMANIEKAQEEYKDWEYYDDGHKGFIFLDCKRSRGEDWICKVEFYSKLGVLWGEDAFLVWHRYCKIKLE